MRMRLLQTRNLVLIALAVAAYGSQACSSNDQEDMVVGQKTTQASSVSIHLEDASGNDIGSCAGTLVAEKLVLTAGHCVVNASTWRVEGAGKVVTAQRAVTPWRKFDSTLSHPLHADIALIALDEGITLARYPSIADEPMKDGAKLTRMHRTQSGSKEFMSSDAVVKDGAANGFHLAYTTELPKGEWLDTGGALFDSKGKIYGVVSSQGKQTSLLYITRVDGFNQWLTASVDECGDAPSALSPRTWGSGGWGGGGTGGTSGGWGGGGSWGGYGGDGKKIEAGAPPSSVDAGTGTGGDGGSGSGSGTGTGGGTGTGTGGGDGSKSGSSGPPGPNANGEVGAGANSGATCPAKPPESSSIPSIGGGAGSGGPNGTNGSSTTGANPSGGKTGTGSGTGGGGGTGTGSGTGTGGGSGSGTGTGTGGGGGAGSNGPMGLDQEPCEGADDNPNICPPDTSICSGPGCGGCQGVSSCKDGTMDYGNCACEAPNSSIGSPDGLR